MPCLQNTKYNPLYGYHFVFFRLMSNWLMTKFNLKGMGEKRAFVETALYRAVRGKPAHISCRTRKENVHS